jgi:hypothetical protein
MLNLRTSSFTRKATLGGMAALLSGTIGLWPTASSAQTATGQGSTAVVSPLLRTASFGDTTGLPLACALGGSLISSVAGQANANGPASPLVAELITQCGTVSQDGAGYLQQAAAASQPLAFINPVANPAISGLASGAETVGNNYGAALAPFGPTIAGLGGPITFFEGS